MSRFILKPQVLIGTGSLIMFGAGIHEYAQYHAKKTGFHVKDPDTNLRIVEKDVLIPKIMRDLSKTVDCKKEVDGFNECCKKLDSGGRFRPYLSFYYCKKENDSMMQCMNNKFIDYDYYLKCKDIYLQRKHLFETTKLGDKERNAVKEAVKNGSKPDFSMQKDAIKYYNSVKSFYETSKDIESYDKSLLESEASISSISSDVQK